MHSVISISWCRAPYRMSMTLLMHRPALLGICWECHQPCCIILVWHLSPPQPMSLFHHIPIGGLNHAIKVCILFTYLCLPTDVFRSCRSPFFCHTQSLGKYLALAQMDWEGWRRNATRGGLCIGGPIQWVTSCLKHCCLCAQPSQDPHKLHVHLLLPCPCPSCRPRTFLYPTHTALQPLCWSIRPIVDTLDLPPPPASCSSW